MSELYQAAIDNPYVDEYGKKRAKFINLDMEEYKDAHLTMRLFKEVLSKPEFLTYSAGIVVQSSDENNTSTVNAEVPLSEMFGFSASQFSINSNSLFTTL